MTQYTIQHKEDVYKRDILRDYALLASELEAQFERFDKSGVLSFSILRGLIGEVHCKGLLWQLKDTAHHLLDKNSTSPAGKHLDWAIGFLFHECIIVQELSYELQKYYPSAQEFLDNIQSGKVASTGKLHESEQAISHLANETNDNLAGMVKRIRYLLTTTNSLMCTYLKNERENRLLARLLYEREELLRSVFKDLFALLMTKIYGEEPEKMLAGAAWSLHESGQFSKAELAAQKALEQNPNCALALDTLCKITHLRR